MNTKKIARDPSLWVLIAVNGYLIYYYYHHREVFTTLIWIYWAQSVLLGLFNFLDMLSLRAPTQTENGAPAAYGLRKFAAFFFLFHYSFFHVGYMVFLISIKPSGPFQWQLLKYFILAFFFGQVINFVQHKVRQRTEIVNISTIFFMPYIRIIPMHLTILAPCFLPVTNMGVFIVLKSITDVLMYTATSTTNKQNKLADSTLLATQQEMNA